MDRKPQISAKATYVFNEGELDQLDELSLTSVIAAARDSLEQNPKGSNGDIPGDGDVASASIEGDRTINELLDGPVWSGDRHSNLGAHSHARTAREPVDVDPSDDLIAPDLLFTGQTGTRDEEPP